MEEKEWYQGAEGSRKKGENNIAKITFSIVSSLELQALECSCPCVGYVS